MGTGPREWSPHSAEKISIFEDYLPLFARASQGSPDRVYIDAFAGTTENAFRATGEPFRGSAEIALDVVPPFSYVALFERASVRAVELQRLADAKGTGRYVRVWSGDSNERIPEALQELPDYAPTFAFLDPDGMEINWRTVELLAQHKVPYIRRRAGRSGTKVEMWILFSIRGVRGCLGRAARAKDPRVRARFLGAVRRLYGAEGPWARIWEAQRAEELSPAEAGRALVFLYLDRLHELGYRHLLYRPIIPKGGALYVMVFATDHPAGGKLMEWAQAQPRVRPELTLFDIETPTPEVEPYTPDWRAGLPFELPEWQEVD